MKQKCEEIIIDQYLKGNITDEEKSKQLWRLNLLKEGQELLEIIYTELNQNPEEFFKLAQAMYKKYDEDLSTFVSDCDLHHLSPTEQKLAFSKNVLCPAFEKNAELNELHGLLKNIIKKVEEETEDELFE